jgi:hypothetical protein
MTSHRIVDLNLHGCQFSTLKMAVAGTGSTKQLVNIYQTIRRLSLEENILHYNHSSALEMDAAGYSETFLISIKPHVITSQKMGLIFIVMSSLP